ncbi:hypothetical protein Rhe02_95400 [Rhizocola hellebori]|uniref:Phospholipase n=1 Tax=Rhizocola hellebori TaxID=1392758 RepID=A0A8J3VMU4_9ACTN|nr:phospholipase A2 [Rhizocola hellebori]GIH11473.1 hypothetical protein Rhe02_95400 [Rhizocola hellebori]
MRWPLRLAVLAAGVAAALTVAAPPSSANATTFDLHAAPADFARVMGYTPAVGRLADGTQRMINPTGSCSVPGEGRPFDFAVACQAHDFGYDLLRYAQRKGQTLPGAARSQLDAQLTQDLHTQCHADSSAATCDATVTVFSAAVGFNSWRQLSGPPVDASGMTRTVGLCLLALIGLGVGVRQRIRLLARRRGDFGG